jgi:hypothetical protein
MGGELERGRRVIYDFGHDRPEEDDDGRKTMMEVRGGM